jgi:hypothetical protein
MTITQFRQKLVSLFTTSTRAPRPPVRASNCGGVDDRLLRCHWKPVHDEDGQLRYEWVSSRRN